MMIPHPPPRSRATGLLVLLLIAIGIAHIATIRPGHDWGDDFAMYILHAKNLAEGVPYGETPYLENPNELIGPPSYPPVFPLFLSVIYRGFGLNLTAMKMGLIVVFLGALAMIFLALRDEAGPAVALAVVAIIGANPFFWEYKDQILSDIPFLFFTYLTCFLLGRAQQAPSRAWQQPWYAAAGGLALLTACGTRTVGVVLAAAIFITDALCRRLSLRVTGLTLLPLAAALLLCAFQPDPDGRNYLQQLPSFNLPLTLTNADHYSKELRNLWRNDYSGAIMRALFLAMNGLALAGYLRRLRAVTLYEVFAALYTIAVLRWHYQGLRLFIPLIPLYIFYAIVGLDYAALRWCPASKRTVFAVLLGIVLASYGGRYTKVERGPIRQGIGQEDVAAAVEYVKQRTSPDAVCIFTKPRFFALYTGRRTAASHAASDEELLNYFERIGADYVIVNRGFGNDQTVLVPLIERHPERFQSAYANGELNVYRVNAL